MDFPIGMASGSGSVIGTPSDGVSHRWEGGNHGDWLLHVDVRLEGLNRCTQRHVGICRVFHSGVVWTKEWQNTDVFALMFRYLYG